MKMSRFFHFSAFYFNNNKSALAALRKKTGFSLNNIRKALDLNNNNPDKAEEWLIEQAKVLNWSTALKVQNRQTSEGLIGVSLKNKKVAMVEVNCETDFVAKNEKFRSFVELATRSCLDIPLITSDKVTNQIKLDTTAFGNLKANNSSLGENLTALIGAVCENIVLKQAFCYETKENDIEVAVAVHPPTEGSEVLFGKYGAFISYRRNPSILSEEESKVVVHNICKHIIGMNPAEITENKESETEKNIDKEKILVHQDYLLDDTITVAELLEDSGITVLDFKRLECGFSETDKTQFVSTEYEEKMDNTAKC